MSDLWRLDATEQARLVRAGRVSPRELVESAIARIERLDPAVNAVIHRMDDYALERASSDALDDGPFRGVPVLVKDACLQLEGTRYTVGLGVLARADYRSPATSESGRRLLRAGFVPLGKTNLPEFSSGVTTEPAAFGPTRNPWDPSRTAGGSSGGSAAAVAAGLVALAHGGDATGSLRYPAAACGVVTLKPSRGRVPGDTPFGERDAGSVWVEFGLARSVRDLAGLLGVLGDPAAPPHRGRRPLRVGLLLHDPLTPWPLDPACRDAVESTGRLLESLGHDVEVSHPPALERLLAPDEACVPWLARESARSAAEQIARLEGMLGRAPEPDEIPAERLALARSARTEDSDEDPALDARFTALLAAVLDWWERDHDVLVTPTLRQPPWLLGNASAGPQVAGIFPAPFSFTGQPAVSLPLGRAGDDLPIGVQLVGPPGGDEALLALAAELEQATPWADRWPPAAHGMLPRP